ncbi:putative Membrane protein, partial [Pseudomonas amygdali pv. eriobotryae]
MMRDNMSDSNETVDAEQPGSPPRQNWRELLSKYRQPIGLAVMLLLFSLALIACRHMLVEMDWYALHDSLFAVPLPALGGALLAAIVGYIILMGYELSASRYANVDLPIKTLLLGGFTSFAIGNAVGLSMLSGGSVRYRLYSRHGVGAIEIARMTVFASLSLGCALPPLA